jgi:hypothetical protein
MFPCKYLSGSMLHSLASQNIGEDGLAVFDSVFAADLDVRHPALDVAWQRVPCRTVDARVVETWLQGVVGTTGVSEIFGTVPVSVHDVTVVGCMEVGHETIAKVEFITFRFGDGHGVHYAAQIGTVPYRFLWYRRLGAVAEADFTLNTGTSAADTAYAPV